MTAIGPGAVTRVQVTADDIANGEAGNCARCPIAIAIGRAAPGRSPHVETDIVCIEDDHPVCAALPRAAQDFIGRFDNALPVEPVEFDLEWEDNS